MTTLELRNKVKDMTKEDFIILRDNLENNWSEKLRPLMQILSLECINKFGTTLSKIG